MQGDRRQARRQSEPLLSITTDEVAIAHMAFLMTHPACEDAVELMREGGSLIFWCKVCQDLHAYQVIDEEDAGHLSSSA